MRGSYILIIELMEDQDIRVGRLGDIRFLGGYYAYVGSAMNSLEGRIDRHKRKEKKGFWHIDYLLQHARIIGVVTIESDRKIECEIAEKLSGIFSSVKGFGSSDCNCKSHLFYSRSPEDLKSTCTAQNRT